MKEEDENVLEVLNLFQQCVYAFFQQGHFEQQCRDKIFDVGCHWSLGIV
jgi:hypothetical protein